MRFGRHTPKSSQRAAGGWTLNESDLDLLVDWVVPLAGAAQHRSSGGLEQDAESGQTAAAGGADAANRQPELVRYLGVGGRRVGHEHFHQPLPLPGQAAKSLADGPVTLIGQQTLIDLGLMRGGLVKREV